MVQGEWSTKGRNGWMSSIELAKVLLRSRHWPMTCFLLSKPPCNTTMTLVGYGTITRRFLLLGIVNIKMLIHAKNPHEISFCGPHY